jgi:heterodisulfide reductase subunit A
MDVCPVETQDTFNAGLSIRKAIYRPVPHAVSSPYVIDTSSCNRCGECEKVCPTGAIDLSTEYRRQFRILVVDDELVVRDSLKEWLVDEGFNVSMAESGHQALDILSSKPFHLMLTDIKMPGMDGVELLKQAKARHPNLTVVMMTAFATVETAVDAMKIGALDYLLKPFDPEKMIPTVNHIYTQMVAGHDEVLEVGAIVLAGGVDYFDPARGKNPFSYGINPHVLTQLEFERLLSNTGPTDGHLIRPTDKKPIEKIAFLQCVGSRDLQYKADFCSTGCCMISVKQAMLTKKLGGLSIRTTIFYMDMRAAGLSYQRLCDKARNENQICFERARVHSLTEADTDRNPLLRYVTQDGHVTEERYDLVVLAAGQRPVSGNRQLAQMAELNLNPWGFIQTVPFSSVSTDNPGVMVAGSYTGFKDITDTVLQASAAASEASRIIHAAGGSLRIEDKKKTSMRDVSDQLPQVLVTVCTCGDLLNHLVDSDRLESILLDDPAVSQVLFVKRLCSTQGWNQFSEMAQGRQPNRILIGACSPHTFEVQLKTLAQKIGLTPQLVEAIELHYCDHSRPAEHQHLSTSVAFAGALARLRRVDPHPAASLTVVQKALVVGGGISGMHAALTIAGQGYAVTLVEKQDRLGGNLKWINRTIEGNDVQQLLSRTVDKVEKHPLINLYLNSTVKNAIGQVGCFYTTVETRGESPQTLQHGAVIMATGGNEAVPHSFGYGKHPAIVTLKELEINLADTHIDPDALNTVVMILCVESRGEPRNYCSRICCPTALKHALQMKRKNPDIALYIIYRDMMTCGFSETYFTQARKAGMIFIPYAPELAPEVKIEEDKRLKVTVQDPILTRPIQIQPDLLVLASGIVPQLPHDLIAAYGAEVTQDGFFKPADVKWRPLEALTQGVYACGLAHSPRNITQAITTAGAAAQQALQIITRSTITASFVTAQVRRSLCSLCERCIEACPYHARMLNAEGNRVVVNPAMCQGCGACAAVCPNSAAIVEGFTQGRMLETIDAALGN